MRHISLSVCVIVLMTVLTVFEPVKAAEYDASSIPAKETGDAFTATELNTLVNVVKGLKRNDQGTSALGDDRFGIGLESASPTQKLEVNGNVKATRFIGDGSQLTNLPEQYWIKSSSDINYPLGNVGIGTSSISPGLKLDIAGKVGAVEYCDALGNNCVVPSDVASSIASGGGASAIQRGGSNPGSGSEGDVFYNTTDNQIYFYNGSSWVEISNSVTDTTPPESPDAGDTYYNTSSNEYFYYDGSSWEVLGGGKWEEGSPSGDIHYSSGKVGIGLTSPGANFYVYQDTPAANQVLVQVGISGDDNRFAIDEDGDVFLDGDLLVRGSDVYDSYGNLELSGEDDIYIGMDWNNNDVDTRALIIGKNSPGPGDNWVELMRVDEDGQVGIGTATPAALLDIAGGVKIGDDTAACDNTKAGTIRYQGGAVQVCDGSTWGSLASGGSSGGGWEEVSLSDTADFDTACDYRTTLDSPSGGQKFYATLVAADYAYFTQWNSSGTEIEFRIPKGSKNSYNLRTGASWGGSFTVNQVEKNCGGSSGGSGEEISFRATGSTTSIASQTWANTIFPTIQHQNGGSNYNASTGKFTAPSTGTYLFTSSLMNGSSNNNGLLIRIYKDLGGGNIETLCLSSARGKNSNLDHAPSCSAVVELAAGDVVQVSGYNTNGASINLEGANTHFSGFKISGGGSGSSGGSSGEEVYVHVATSAAKSIPQNAWTEIVLDSVGSDSRNLHDTATGRFTPNVAGKYLVIANVVCRSIDANKWCSTTISKNGASVANDSGYVNLNGSDAYHSITQVVEMNGTTDYLSVIAHSNDATPSVAATMKAYLLGSGGGSGSSGGSDSASPVAFSARQTAVQSGAGAMVYDTVDLDTDSGFDATTGIYTVPTKGIYNVCWQYYNHNNAEFHTEIHKNGAVVNGGQSSQYNNPNAETNSGCVLIDAAVNDELSIYFSNRGRVNLGHPADSLFYGYMLGGGSSGGGSSSSTPESAFTVVKTAHQSASTGDVVTWDLALTNIGDDFDLTNNRYVAPSDGTYHFSYEILGQNNTDNSDYWVYKNGVNMLIASYGGVGGSVRYRRSDASFILELTAGDQIDIRAAGAETPYGSAGAYHTHFSGFKMSGGGSGSGGSGTGGALGTPDFDSGWVTLAAGTNTRNFAHGFGAEPVFAVGYLKDSSGNITQHLSSDGNQFNGGATKRGSALGYDATNIMFSYHTTLFEVASNDQQYAQTLQFKTIAWKEWGSGGSGSSSLGGGWEEVSLSDTNSFDTSCDYRAEQGSGNIMYAYKVKAAEIFFVDFASSGTNFEYTIQSSAKGTRRYRTEGTASYSTDSAVTSLQKNCGGSGSSSSGGGSAVSFQAIGDGTQTATHNTWSDLVFATEIQEEGGNNYDTSTGKFTVPSTGFYQFNASAEIEASGSDQIIRIQKNHAGKSAAADSICYARHNTTVSGNSGAFSCSGIAYLNANDVVEVIVYHNGGTARTVRESHFSGFKVGGSSGSSSSSTPTGVFKSGWPDALKCTQNGYTRMFIADHDHATNGVYYVANSDPSDSDNAQFIFHPTTKAQTAAYQTHATGSDCNGKSIDTLISEGKVIYFGGGGSSSGGGSALGLEEVASGTATVPGNSYASAVTGLANGYEYIAALEPTYSTAGCGYMYATFGTDGSSKISMTIYNNAGCGGTVDYKVYKVVPGGGSGSSSGAAISDAIAGSNLASTLKLPVAPAGVSKWPDYLMCNYSSGTWGQILVMSEHKNDSVWYAIVGNFNRYIAFDGTGNISGISGLSTRCGATDGAGVDLADICDEGRCGYFGSSGGSSGGGRISGEIQAFDLTSCPAGWSEYTAARGRFLRGIDSTGTIDPGGVRAPGSTQEDEFKSHEHIPQNSYNGSGWSFGGHYQRGYNNGVIANASNAVGGAETRPKNVAVLYCRKN